MRTSELDYDLPPGAIAQTPVEPRDSARLLVAVDEGVEHRHIRDVPELVGPGDVLVLNDTRVFPARLLLQRKTGGIAEVLLLEQLASGDEWTALARPSRRLRAGEVLCAGERSVVELLDMDADGSWVVRLLVGRAQLDEIGVTPLPPYIEKALPDDDRYQTVYARPDARSVAAPTAGLHLTAPLLDACLRRGATIERLDLTVGIATFRPIAAESVEDHVMHAEAYDVPDSTLEACARAERVIAVGTTTLRALESAARGPRSGRTDLFITAGFEFRVVDTLLTNFHLPRSSLLALLHAFVGDRWRSLYEEALREGYRFLSFGDAMLVDRRMAA